MPTKPRKRPQATGPLTLAEANALVAASRPAQKRAKGKAPAAETAPIPLAVERRRLERARQQEKRRLIEEYTATMRLLKERGLKGLGPKRKRGEKVAKAAARPLQVLAEGDSWFKYPVPLFGGGIVRRLQDRIGVPILNLAKAGDEVRYMLGVAERKEIIAQLTRGCPAGGPWDVMLFSGGGNDIVDNPMALWIRDYDATATPAQLIHQPRLDAALALVRAGYEDLIGLRDALSPVTHLVFHAYDFAIPDGRGICHLGPWLKPTFDLRRFPDRASASAVVEAMLRQFAAMLQVLAAAHPKVTFINGQGTLARKTSSWHNELHPSKLGFTTFAAIFQRELKALFPGRVL